MRITHREQGVRERVLTKNYGEDTGVDVGLAPLWALLIGRPTVWVSVWRT